MAFEPSWWEHDLDRAAYRANRAHLLNTMMLDHLVWVQSLEQFRKDASLAAIWSDCDGQDRVTAINQAFLATHLHILRSVMHDLAKCGPEGQRIMRTIFADHLSMLRDQEDGIE